jgi:hypothetical protein
MEISASSSRVNCCSISARSELILSECALNIAEVIGMVDDSEKIGAASSAFRASV